MKNLQGDVVAILNYNNSIIATYEYDAWGNIISIKNEYGNDITSSTGYFANINPIRYRGYYYDTETGFYYLNSRYYDPANARFISADDPTVVTDSSTVTDKNLFAYCDNDPVNRIDTNGEFWESILDVVSLGASIVEVAVNPTDPLAWAGLVGDTVDLLPFVTGIGEATKAITTTKRVVDNASDVIDTATDLYKSADTASDIKKATGSYEIMYENGNNYVGKGGFNRAITSAKRYATSTNPAISIKWKSAPDVKSSFIDEYYMQQRAGGVLSSNKSLPTYNKIWSPGRKYVLK